MWSLFRDGRLYLPAMIYYYIYSIKLIGLVKVWTFRSRLDISKSGNVICETPPEIEALQQRCELTHIKSKRAANDAKIWKEISPFLKLPTNSRTYSSFSWKMKKNGKCQKQEYDFWKLVPTRAFSTIRIHFLFSSTVWLLRFDSLALDELLLNWSKYSNIYIVYKKKTYKNKVRIFEFHHDPNLIQWNL